MGKNLTYEEIKKAADEYEADDIIVNAAFIAGASWAKGYLLGYRKEVKDERED